MAIDGRPLGKGVRIFALTLLLAGLAFLLPAQAITEQNWLNHPAIKEIRAIFSDTEQAVSARRLIQLHLTGEDIQAWGLDAGHVRKLSVQRGSDDSAMLFDHYYDPAGTLRFAFVRANAVNGTRVEYRIYFDERGQRIWSKRQQAAGPGYPFPDEIPDDWLLADPQALIERD